MTLINYQLPLKILNSTLPDKVEVFNLKKHKSNKHRNKYVVHAHFLSGVQVYDHNCVDCVGVLKPKKSAKELAERRKMKQQYIKEYYDS